MLCSGHVCVALEAHFSSQQVTKRAAVVAQSCSFRNFPLKSSPHTYLKALFSFLSVALNLWITTMSFLDTLRQWDEAVACVDKAHLSQALEILVSIEEPNSKIYFNIGCLHLINQELDAAEKAFDRSIGKDEHLAVAFFQRGITFYKKKRYEESFADFQHAFKELRGNQLIDYKALGLRHKLHACEVLHNMALSEAHLGHWEKAREHLVSALNYKTESKLNLIDRALQSTLKQKLFQPAVVSSTALFRPNKHYVAELEKRDYLGKAKVVSSIIPQDEFSGFAPLQPQVEDGPIGPKAPEVLRAFEGEPHIVLFEFVPETSGELAVVPGNIVFVLQKGADNWASVVFNGRRGLVPHNYLERMEINLTSKPNQAADGGEKSACIVKVHYTFNLALYIDCGSPYATLAEMISKKLLLPADKITLSSTSPAAGLTVMDASTDMQGIWSSANCGRITLWCDIKEEPLKDNNPGVQMHVIALYSYESTNLEDLTFNQGDTILLLTKVNQDWFEGQCNGETGIFPAAFVEVPVDAK
ncbi:Neutrophil cytosol factor 2 [Merluccius polli]|uniref:Neutrophil cytosol factor 2 n=1 Tax=Merluccius polli TaxID=89951 RepID=A0AA47MQJ1_MERPO|nr:Neutrophil cytosol factor 2 [Merluccius polli]